MDGAEWPDLSDETRQAWDTNAAFWDNRMGEGGNEFASELVFPSAERLLNLQPGDLLLEIACGNGTFARRMASQGVRVKATDFSLEMIAHARSYGSQGIDYQVLDAADRQQLLALGTRQFEAAVCNMGFMDMAAIQPALETLPALLKPGGCFVFTLMHPCFNSYKMVMVAEEEDRDGQLITVHSVKIPHYRTPTSFRGLAIIGQPVPQLYFHRPLYQLLGMCFQAGWVVDGLEEPAFEERHEPRRVISWFNYSEIPPVLAVRLRLWNPAG
jgi:SAM-dependent methyltransferase